MNVPTKAMVNYALAVWQADDEADAATAKEQISEVKSILRTRFEEDTNEDLVEETADLARVLYSFSIAFVDWHEVENALDAWCDNKADGAAP